MKEIVKIFSFVLLIYLASWTAMYFFLMGADASYFLDYLKLSWLGGGEIPGFIHLGALAVTVVGTFFFIIFSRKRLR